MYILINFFPVYFASAEAIVLEQSDVVDVSNHTYTYSEMESDIITLSSLYPDYIHISSVGTSVDNRNIWPMIIGNPNAPKTIYWNVGQSDALYANTLQLAQSVQGLTSYKLGNASVIHGLDYNWLICERQIPTVLIETGTVACPLPYSQWNSLWTHNKDVLASLAILYLV